ncbi:MAG: HTH-type transcriptional regulator LutR [Desulfovibrio sp.]
MASTAFVTKQQFAYDAIKADIDNGTYPPGARLVISRIAKSLQISDIPVRESLKILEAEGVVVNRPHAGFVVTVPNFQDSWEMFHVRQLLEGEATYLATKNITPELTALMREKLDAMESPGVDLVTAGLLNREFHQAFYKACGNGYLLSLLGQITAKTIRAQSVYVLCPQQLAIANREHREIFAAITAGNAEEARALLLAHKAASYSLLISYLEKNSAE